jgi:hypothetical protein
LAVSLSTENIPIFPTLFSNHWDKDIIFTREPARRGIVSRDRLLMLLGKTSISKEVRRGIHTYITEDFGV